MLSTTHDTAPSNQAASDDGNSAVNLPFINSPEAPVTLQENEAIVNVHFDLPPHLAFSYSKSWPSLCFLTSRDTTLSDLSKGVQDACDSAISMNKQMLQEVFYQNGKDLAGRASVDFPDGRGIFAARTTGGRFRVDVVRDLFTTAELKSRPCVVDVRVSMRVIDKPVGCGTRLRKESRTVDDELLSCSADPDLPCLTFNDYISTSPSNVGVADYLKQSDHRIELAIRLINKISPGQQTGRRDYRLPSTVTISVKHCLGQKKLISNALRAALERCGAQQENPRPPFASVVFDDENVHGMPPEWDFHLWILPQVHTLLPSVEENKKMFYFRGGLAKYMDIKMVTSGDRKMFAEAHIVPRRRTTRLRKVEKVVVMPPPGGRVKLRRVVVDEGVQVDIEVERVMKWWRSEGEGRGAGEEEEAEGKYAALKRTIEALELRAKGVVGMVKGEVRGSRDGQISDVSDVSDSSSSSSNSSSITEARAEVD